METLPHLPMLPANARVIVAGQGIMGHQVALAIANHPNLTLLGVIPWEATKTGQQTDRNPGDDSDTFLAWVTEHALGIPCKKGINASAAALANQQPHLIILATWGEILNEAALNTLPCPVINIHPSLLPAYRGANPYSATILNQEPHTGLTAHVVTPAIDAGPILGQVTVSIHPDDTGGSLKARCADTVSGWLPLLLSTWQTAPLTQTPQAPAPSGKEHAPNLTLWNGQLTPYTHSTSQLQRQIRAYHPWLPCFTHVISRVQCLPGQAKTLLVCSSRTHIAPTPTGGPLGEIIYQPKHPRQLAIRCRDHRWLQVSLTAAYWGNVPIHPRLFGWLLPSIIGVGNSCYLSAPEA